MDRRAFLEHSGTAGAVALSGPFVRTSRGEAQTDRLVVAVGQWGIETPLAWRGVQAEKPLRDCVYDPLITRDLGQKLYDGYYGVKLGMKSLTWAVTKKVGVWPTLAYVPAETNYELIAPAG